MNLVHDERGKVIGSVKDHLLKLTKKDEHVFRRYDSFNIWEGTLKEAAELGAEMVEINYYGQSLYYALDDWLASDLKYEYRKSIQRCVRRKDLWTPQEVLDTTEKAVEDACNA